MAYLISRLHRASRAICDLCFSAAISLRRSVCFISRKCAFARTLKMLPRSTVRQSPLSRCYLTEHHVRNQPGGGEAAEALHRKVHRERDAHHLQQRRGRGQHPGLVVRLLPSHVHTGDGPHAPLPRQIQVPSLFTEYRIQSNADNEIYLGVATDALAAALKSAAAPSGQQGAFSGDAEVIVRCVIILFGCLVVRTGFRSHLL